VRRGPTIQTKMSLATAGIHSTISPSLTGAMEDCSIVRSSSCKSSITEGAVCVTIKPNCIYTLKEDLDTLGVDWSDARDTANDSAR